MLAETRDLEDVRTIRDQAEAMRVYARQHKLGIEAQNHAGAIAVEADIRRGEILKEMAEAGERATPETARSSARSELDRPPTLADLNTTKRESANAQAMADEAEVVRAWVRTAKVVTPTRAARIARQARHRAEVKAAPPLPTDLYNVILADPPWAYRNDGGLPGQAENHYSTMSADDIRALAIPSTENAVLFLWVTNPMLEEAFELVRAWGFTYKTNVVWVKRALTRPGVGFYVRGRHELLFICTRGSMVPESEGRAPVGSVIEADIGRHSSKPEEAYALIETLYPQGKYLELFARSSRPGWTTWGADSALAVASLETDAAGGTG